MTEKKFMTAPEFAKLGVLSLRETRARIHQGKCPGIWTGANKERFVINVEKFIAQLEAESENAQ